MKKWQANSDLATDKGANLGVQDVGGGPVRLCQVMKQGLGKRDQGGTKRG